MSCLSVCSSCVSGDKWCAISLEIIILKFVHKSDGNDECCLFQRLPAEFLSNDLTLQELRKLAEENPNNKSAQKRLLVKACAVGVRASCLSVLVVRFVVGFYLLNMFGVKSLLSKVLICKCVEAEL